MRETLKPTLNLRPRRSSSSRSSSVTRNPRPSKTKAGKVVPIAIPAARSAPRPHQTVPLATTKSAVRKSAPSIPEIYLPSSTTTPQSSTVKIEESVVRRRVIIENNRSPIIPEPPPRIEQSQSVTQTIQRQSQNKPISNNNPHNHANQPPRRIVQVLLSPYLGTRIKAAYRDPVPRIQDNSNMDVEL